MLSFIKREKFSLAMLIALFAMSAYFYQVFPDSVPVHWNIKGEVDAYGSRANGAFAIPLMSLGIYLLFLALPYLDPKRERYAEFAKTYQIFKSVFVVFMSVLYLIVGLNILGFPIAINVAMPIMVGLLFIILGNYMSKIKQNWFMGVRTPWALSSEENWNKTNRMSAKIFVISGILFMLMPLYPDALIVPVFVVLITAMVFGTIGYSFYLFKKEQHGNK